MIGFALSRASNWKIKIIFGIQSKLIEILFSDVAASVLHFPLCQSGDGRTLL